MRGSRTEKNLLASFAGESQARNRYTYFASRARKDGYVQIATIFEETANQEKEHAKRFFSQLQGGDLMVEASFPSGVIKTTAENLQAAASGENMEWTTLYPGFAQIAREEGFEDIATSFKEIAARAINNLSDRQSGPFMAINCGVFNEELLANVKQQYPATQVVVLTAHGTIDSAVKAPAPKKRKRLWPF